MLDVIVGCTRKTEITYWKKLFDVVGSPQVLFEQCIKLGKLKTAGGYLLVLHHLDQFNRGSEDTRKLLKMAYDAHDWDLCKELARFLTAIDPTGKTLVSSIQASGLGNILDGIHSIPNE